MTLQWAEMRLIRWICGVMQWPSFFGTLFV